MATQGSGGEWTVVEYERTRGDFPVRTFLAELEGRHARDAASLIIAVKALGNTMRPPKSQLVQGTLYELRGHQVRIFYCFFPGRRIVLLDGVIKKQDKLRQADVARALEYQRDVERRGPAAP